MSGPAAFIPLVRCSIARSHLRNARLTLLLGLFFACSQAAQAADEPVFPPAPRVAICAAEAQALRAAANYPQQQATAIKAGEALLAKPVEVPAGPGNWIFYYACPTDGSTLKPLSEQEHQCPQCRQTYTDQRTVEAYRTRLHNQVDEAALKLGWAYWHSEDVRFAREVRRLLVRLADDYPNYPLRRDRWGRTGIFAAIGGRRYIQSLDEAVAILPLAKAYDLTRNCQVWSADDRRHVEEDLFRNVAKTLTWWNQGRNNHQTWYNAGLMAIASVLADSELVHKALDGPGGFYDQLARSVGDDGLWYEGAMAYHNYALQAMIQIVEIGHRLNLPLAEQPRFHAMFTGPLDYVYPNGQFPAINDSDPARINSFDAHFAWAWRTYHEPLFAQAYARGDAKRLSQLLGDNPGPAIIDPNLPPLRSKNLSGAGLAVLRRGQGNDAVCAMLDYGQHGEGHGHYDKLNLVLFADGREWLLDPGRLTYSHPEYQTWVKETAAHNTVTLGGKSQRATTGELLSLDGAEGFSSCVARSTGSYSGAALTRYLVLTDTLLVDCVEVTSPQKMQIDWHAHAVARQLLPLNELPSGEPATLGSDSGYQHLRDGVVRSVSGPSRWRFVEDKDNQLDVWVLDRGEQRIFQSLGIGYNTSQAVPCLTRRLEADRATFWTVYDLFPARGVLKNAALAEDSTNEVMIETTAGDWQVICHEGKVTCHRLAGP